MKIEKEILSAAVTNTRQNLADLLEKQAVLLIFLRHFGCVFCREAMADIAKLRPEIEKKGVQIVFVHFGDSATAKKFFKKFKLETILHIEDGDLKLYEYFGLKKASNSELFGLKVWMRGLSEGVFFKYGAGFPGATDGFQMPGVFLLDKGEIKASFIHESTADRPDYLELAACCVV